MPWACLSYTPGPLSPVVFPPLGHMCPVDRPHIQAPELLGAAEWGFRNANQEFIQPPAFEVRGTQAKLQGQIA